ncbi:hypothetical protein [Roseiterribacter gracilis]|uniref:DUF4199 domain-containing protein n=1 Tax=Roseiterribacter gracilis TaxID=2812848 RepID=A0A8S8XF29_9PROT|nr:hypothetical protein TMPK1_27760 [Rhodospirillales bacterium TMPK1]
MNPTSVTGRLSWGAVLAGAAFSTAILVALHPICSRLGLVWVIATVLALAAGAYLAARISRQSGALHGVTVWAVVVVATNLSLIPLAARSDPGIAAMLARADSPDGVQLQLRQLMANPSSVDRASLTRAMAAQAGIPEDQATARLEQFESQARSSTLWTFAALLAGLAAAWFGGIRGARETFRA